MFFFFKQKTAYEMRISDWSSDVCSSDLPIPDFGVNYHLNDKVTIAVTSFGGGLGQSYNKPFVPGMGFSKERANRSEEHTSELQSLMRISYAVFCLKKKIKQKQIII